MNYQELIKKEMLPLKWCPGCGIHTIFYTMCEILGDLKDEVVIVSGIGCTGRIAAHFNLGSVHVTHGRAIPVAVGIKKANPKLKVIVISGEGDLLSIGGNHFLHSALRNDDITVICNNNEVFGMTGGQKSPTTRIGGKTRTTITGNIFEPMNIQKIILSNKKYFYARTSTFLKEHLKETIIQAINHPGFSFTEIVSPCIENFVKKQGQTLKDTMDEIKNYKISRENRILNEKEFGVVKND
jgi:2-oxoglutarate ferredoxin oxidoreductase subunit beta